MTDYKMKITIVGAGPIGAYTAYLLAKKGQDVSVYEEHSVIGKPVQCTGIVSSEFAKIIKLDNSFVVNKLNKIKIYSKHKCISLDINDLVINREKFDKFIVKKAKKEGVNFKLNHKYLGISKEYAIFADKNKKFVRVNSDIIIGADGPRSDVAKSNKMFDREHYIGIQARIKGKFEKNTYEVYLGSICPDFFAWVVPESDKIARIGIASKEKVVMKNFIKFLKIKNVKEKDIIEKQAGLIPIWNKEIIVKKDNVYLVGDSAGQVKASTGGGLVPGMKSAKILVDCVVNKKDYNKELNKINRELNMHLMIRSVLDKFSDKDYDNLLGLLKQKRILNLLKYNNRDNSIKLLLKMILKEPRFLMYLTKTL